MESKICVLSIPYFKLVLKVNIFYLAVESRTSKMAVGQSREHKVHYNNMESSVSTKTAASQP